VDPMWYRSQIGMVSQVGGGGGVVGVGGGGGGGGVFSFCH